MLHRRPFKQLSTLEDRLAEEAINLRKQAEGMPLSIRRDELMRKADQMDHAAHMNAWLTSPGLCAPIQIPKLLRLVVAPITATAPLGLRTLKEKPVEAGQGIGGLYCRVSSGITDTAIPASS